MTTDTATQTTTTPALNGSAPQNALTVAEETGVSLGTKKGFEAAQRVALALSKSSLVPALYQGDKGMPNCLIAINMANRIGADPLMVMQNLYVVQGKPSWSAKFMIGTFNSSGKFSALRYEWVGETGKDSYGCRAYAVETATGEKLVGPAITWDLVKKEGWENKGGSKWKSMPEKMFMYRAAAWFIDLYAPEISQGLRTRDEEEDILLNATPSGNGSYEVTDGGIPNVMQSLNAKLHDEKPPVIDAETGEVIPPAAASGPKPTKRPGAKSCEECVGTGFRVTEEGKEPCAACNGSGKA